MFPKKPEHFWPLLWGGACAMLLVVLALEYQFGRARTDEGARAPAKVAEAKLLPVFRLPPDQQAGTETLARPLFVPARRPSPPAVDGGTGTMKKGQFVLQGTTLVGSLSIAMLKEVKTGTVHRVEKGGEIMGMTLAEVSSEQVVLKAGGDSEMLPLLVARGAGNAAAAVERGPFGPSSALPGNAPPAQAPAPQATGSSTPSAPVPARTPGTVPIQTVRPAAAAPSPASVPMTPEEILARRREARRSQPQN